MAIQNNRKTTKKLALNKRGFDDLWLVQSSSYAVSRSDGRCWCRFITAAEVWAGAAAVMKARENSVHHCHLGTLRRMNTVFVKCVTISGNTASIRTFPDVLFGVLFLPYSLLMIPGCQWDVPPSTSTSISCCS